MSTQASNDDLRSASMKLDGSFMSTSSVPGGLRDAWNVNVLDEVDRLTASGSVNMSMIDRSNRDANSFTLSAEEVHRLLDLGDSETLADLLELAPNQPSENLNYHRNTCEERLEILDQKLPGRASAEAHSGLGTSLFSSGPQVLPAMIDAHGGPEHSVSGLTTSQYETGSNRNACGALALTNVHIHFDGRSTNRHPYPIESMALIQDSIISMSISHGSQTVDRASLFSVNHESHHANVVTHGQSMANPPTNQGGRVSLGSASKSNDEGVLDDTPLPPGVVKITNSAPSSSVRRSDTGDIVIYVHGDATTRITSRLYTRPWSEPQR